MKNLFSLTEMKNNKNEMKSNQHILLTWPLVTFYIVFFGWLALCFIMFVYAVFFSWGEIFAILSIFLLYWLPIVTLWFVVLSFLFSLLNFRKNSNSISILTKILIIVKNHWIFILTTIISIILISFILFQLINWKYEVERKKQNNLSEQFKEAFEKDILNSKFEEENNLSEQFKQAIEKEETKN